MSPFVVQKKAAPAAGLDLSSIRIASPCPADWEKMVGDERVRHCAECNLNVYNLSALTEREARQLLEGNNGNRVCLRLYRRADGTIITQDCPWGFRALRRRAGRLASALFSAALSVSVARAKPIPQQNQQPTEEGRKLQSNLLVTVLDPQGAVIANAQVILAGPKNNPGPQAKGVTDNMGKMEFSGLAAGEYTITVGAKYFLTERQSNLQLSAGKFFNLVIKLKVDPKETTTVEVGAVDMPLIQQDSQVSHTFYLDR
jgi:Carboxypeptidase regulatory-like domain